jgi:hypothetical protein
MEQELLEMLQLMLDKEVQLQQEELLDLKFNPIMPRQRMEDCIMVDILETGVAAEVQAIMEVAVEQMMAAMVTEVVAEVR